MDDVEFANRVDALFGGMRDRLPEKTYQFMSRAAEDGEYGDVLDVLLAALQEERFPISRQEHDELRAIMESVSFPDYMYDSINRWEYILFVAEVIEPEPPPPGPSVTICDNPDFDNALQAQAGVHINLPPHRFESFVDHVTTTGGVGAQLDLARTIPAQNSRGGETRKPTTDGADIVATFILTISLRSIWGGGVLLRNFEHWWTENRSDAEILIRQIPTILAAEQYGDDNFHIALADMSSSTVDQVIALLTESEVLDAFPEPVPPVPLFKYPPM
ncbi:hypothetical protein MOQ72_25115 [Saccharopolyspora sp. K220]|uniref:hypothetical protein n=1 Tax=Saccharopolyspora soli TaxID=2926618 RepID=UPI001F59B6EB|nr:hypothetical protein [Saccharopolyspora soli]MCI2420733.1 hypothetical protein [Saccharopolyspora soli]